MEMGIIPLVILTKNNYHFHHSPYSIKEFVHERLNFESTPCMYSSEVRLAETIIGSTNQQPLLDSPKEVFQLPTSKASPCITYDLNIHIMIYGLPTQRQFSVKAFKNRLMIFIQSWCPT